MGLEDAAFGGMKLCVQVKVFCCSVGILLVVVWLRLRSETSVGAMRSVCGGAVLPDVQHFKPWTLYSVGPWHCLVAKDFKLANFLQEVANSRIGDNLRRGVSGGERRRVAIGLEELDWSFNIPKTSKQQLKRHETRPNSKLSKFQVFAGTRCRACGVTSYHVSWCPLSAFLYATVF